jgi:hypothetical protein
MRTISLATLVAAGMGLAGTSGASALSVNGAAIGDIATATDHVTQVQWGHGRWGSFGGGHGRWGSFGGGHGRWGSFGGGHGRWGSFGGGHERWGSFGRW